MLTCRAKRGVCAKCYGRDLAHGQLVEIGETIGIIAAQSIGEPGTQLTMRTFHIGGTASRRAERHVIATDLKGSLEFSPDVRLVRSGGGRLVVMSRKGELLIRDENGVPRERHELVYGAHLKLDANTPENLALPETPMSEMSAADLKIFGQELRVSLEKIKDAPTKDKVALSQARLAAQIIYERLAGLAKAGEFLDNRGRTQEDLLNASPLMEAAEFFRGYMREWETAGQILGQVGLILDEYDMKDPEDSQRLKDDFKLTVNQPGEFVDWDPFTVPILTEVTGYAQFVDVEEGKTMVDKVDPVTGKSSKVIIESKDADARPQIKVVDENGRALLTNKGTPAVYILPVNAILMIEEKQLTRAGEALAKIPRETTKTKDITGGLPRVAELFEVRKPKEVAVISEIDGVVSFGKQIKGKRKVVVTPEVGEPKEYLIPKGKHVTVHEGDFVRAGESLMDGAANPHDILAIRGVKELAKYLVDEVQQVYRLQGVKINDKHIEVIVRQMLRKVKVKSAGDSDLLVGEFVDRQKFDEINENLLQAGDKPAAAEPLLQGITKASLSTESFISAASFQETTKVLTEAAVVGKVDILSGLKENVIMGRLVPAGSGLPKYLNSLDEAQEMPAA